MRHALFLRLLNIPLIAAIAIMSAIVCIHPWYWTKVSVAEETRPRKLTVPPWPSVEPKSAVKPSRTTSMETEHESAEVQVRLLDGVLDEPAVADVERPQAVEAVRGGGDDDSRDESVSPDDAAVEPTAPAFAGDDPPATEPPAGDENGTDPSAIAGDNRIEVVNPYENRAAVAFVVDNQVHTVQPGRTVILPGPARTIWFDRGAGHGAARQDLKVGQYRFEVSSESGWSLLDATR